MNINKPDINISDFTDKIAEKYFRNKIKQYGNKKSADKTIGELNKIRRKTLSFAALYGILGVLFLYIPQYIFPEYFAGQQYEIPLVNKQVKFSIFELIYGFILVIIEIFFLMKGDIEAVSKIAAFYGLNPDKHKQETSELVKTALNKTNKRYTEIGLNPYQNFSKTGLILIRILFLAKAFLSNFVFKIIIKRVAGRLAIREITDLAGIPVYAFWNAYASSLVIRKADMQIKASELIKNTGEYFKNKYENNPDFKKMLYDTFEYIALTKKSFYPTDMIFAKHFFDTFDIKIKKEHILSPDYLKKLEQLPDDIKYGIGKILILGFLLDGKIGSFEIKELKKLKKRNIIPYTVEQIKSWTKNYKLGNGFNEMFTE